MSAPNVPPDGFREALVIRPGDTLIVRVGRNFTEESAAAMYAQMQEFLPADVTCLVVAAEQLAVYRPDPQ